MWIIHRNYFLKDYQVEKVLWRKGAIESLRVTAKLKGLNKTLLSFHCICHRLALPCANASDDVSFIKDVEATLKHLWKFFENSSKKTAAYIQTQENLREINLSKKRQENSSKKDEESLQNKVAKSWSFLVWGHWTVASNCQQAKDWSNCDWAS